MVHILNVERLTACDSMWSAASTKVIIVVFVCFIASRANSLCLQKQGSPPGWLGFREHPTLTGDRATSNVSNGFRPETPFPQVTPTLTNSIWPLWAASWKGTSRRTTSTMIRLRTLPCSGTSAPCTSPNVTMSRKGCSGRGSPPVTSGMGVRSPQYGQDLSEQTSALSLALHIFLAEDPCFFFCFLCSRPLAMHEAA